MDYLDNIQERHKELYEKIYNSHKTHPKKGNMFLLESDATCQLYIGYDENEEIFVVCSDEDALFYFTSINQYKGLLKLLKMQAMS